MFFLDWLFFLLVFNGLVKPYFYSVAQYTLSVKYLLRHYAILMAIYIAIL